MAADVWRVESLVHQGASAAALELADHALGRTKTTPGVAILAAMLQRLRGWAFMQLRDLERAGAAFDESLELARIEGENIGMRSADYEVALTLDALGRLGEMVGGANRVTSSESGTRSWRSWRLCNCRGPRSRSEREPPFLTCPLGAALVVPLRRYRHREAAVGGAVDVLAPHETVCGPAAGLVLSWNEGTMPQ